MEKSKLVLGTVQFGCQYGINSAGRPTADAVTEILKEAYAHGITTLDTSSAYGNAEEVLGTSIRLCGLKFDIISKYPQGAGPVGTACKASIARLRADHLYGYLLHHFSLYRKDPEIWNQFIKLKEEGLTGKIGFSLYTPDELELILSDDIKFDMIQIPHNVFDRKFDPYFPELKKRNVEIHVRSTFLQGLFFKDRNDLPETLQPLKPYLSELDGYSATHGLSISELAMNFNVRNPDIDGVLIGVDNATQLLNNINSLKDCDINLNINVKEQDLLNPVNWNK